MSARPYRGPFQLRFEETSTSRCPPRKRILEGKVRCFARSVTDEKLLDAAILLTGDGSRSLWNTRIERRARLDERTSLVRVAKSIPRDAELVSDAPTVVVASRVEVPSRVWAEHHENRRADVRSTYAKRELVASRDRGGKLSTSAIRRSSRANRTRYRAQAAWTVRDSITRDSIIVRGKNDGKFLRNRETKN